MLRNIGLICLLLGSVILASIIVGCGVEAPYETTTTLPTGGISGKVVDNNGDPAANVSVTLTSTSYLPSSATSFSTQTTTDSNGSFSFSDVSEGTYNVQADQSNQYKVIEQNVIISAGSSSAGLSGGIKAASLNVDLGTLTLQQTGAISGYAYFVDKSNHLGMDVFIPGTSFTAKTAADGSYTILYIPPGTFDLNAMYTAYQTTSEAGIVVQSASTTAVPTILLYPQAGGTYGNVTYDVRDYFTGSKLQGATITIGYVSKESASNGAATFNNVWAASQFFTASKEGYEDYSGTITVVANTTTDQTIWMTSSSFAITTWGSSGTGDGQFDLPLGIITDSNSNVFVADGNNKRVQKFNSSGSYVTKWSSGSYYPKGIGIDSGDNVYVGIFTSIIKYDNNGSSLLTFGSNGSGDGQFAGGYGGAHGVALNSGGNIYAVDPGNNRVQKFNSSGTFLSKFGTSGSGDGQFSYGVMDVAIDSNGNIFVSDDSNHCVQKFDSSGNFVAKWGSEGTGNGQFSDDNQMLDMGIGVDSSGNVYVADTGNNRVQKFDNDGNFLTKWGSSGTGNGQFSNPVDVAVDINGNVYISDNGNSRIQKFSQ